MGAVQDGGAGVTIIKLTFSDSGEPVYINTEYIAAFHSEGDHTEVLVGKNCNRVYWVREAPEVILKLIGMEERPKQEGV